MAFAELVSLARVDLREYEKGLNEMVRRWKETNEQIARQSVQIRSLASGGTGRSGSSGRTVADEAIAESKRVKQAQIADAQTVINFQNAETKNFLENEKKKEKARLDREKLQRQADEADAKTVLFFQNEKTKNFLENEKKKEKALKETQKEQVEAAAHLFRGATTPGGVGGSRGAFIEPAALRGLDEAQQKWLKAQQEIAKSDSLVKQFGYKLHEIGGNVLESMVTGFKQIAATVGITAGAGIVGGVALLTQKGFELNRLWDVNKLAIADVLSLTTKLTDTQGRSVSATKEISYNLATSEHLMNQLREASFKTLIPAEQLESIFRRVTGAATTGGVALGGQVALVSKIANLAAALGATNETQIAQEELGLFTGVRVRQTRIGRALGISNEDIQKAQQAGKLQEYLNARLREGDKYAEKFGQTYQAAITNLISKSNEFIRLGTHNSVQSITDAIVKLNNYLTEDRIKKWAKSFSEGIDYIRGALSDFGKSDAFGYLKFLASSVANAGKFYAEPLTRDIQSAKAEADIARKVANETPEQRRLRTAMGEVMRRGTALNQFQTAAAGQAFHRGEQLGVGRGLSHPEYTGDELRQIRTLQNALAIATNEEKAAQEALTISHIQNELKRGGASRDRIIRTSNANQVANEKAKKAAENERLFIAREYAKLQDDKIQKIQEEAEAEVQNVQKHVKEEQKRVGLIRAIWEHAHTRAKDILQEQAKTEREVIQDRLQGLHNEYRERADLIKSAQTLEKQTAHQMIELRKEREKAIRDETRAIEDQAVAERRLGVAGTESHNLVLQRRITGLLTRNIATSRSTNVATGESTNFSNGRNSVLDQLSRIFAQQEGPANFNAQGEFILPQTHREESEDALRRGKARAAVTVQDIAKQFIAGGDVGGVEGQLSKLGIDLRSPGGASLLKSLRGMRTDVLESKAAEGGIQDTLAETAVTRGREDARQRVTDAGQQINEVNQKIVELQKSYTDTIKELNEKFRNAVRTTTESLIKASEAARKFFEDLTGGVHVAAPDRRFLQQLTNVTPQRAAALARQEFAPAQNVIFAAGSINISGVKDLDMNHVADQLQKALRMATPPRR
jgi:hypothetical protein